MAGEVSQDLEAVLAKTDVVYLLRMQKERLHEALVPSLREYTARTGASRRPAPDRLQPDALIMHPGPSNLGVEIAAEVAALPNAVITEQVTNGVAVRMAVLFNLLSQTDEVDLSDE